MPSSDYEGAEPYLPDETTPASLRDAGADCRGCDLYENARCFVAGSGNTDAELMLVGEAPGKNEDRQGRPFVGAAGRRLDTILGECGIDRKELYISNGVKHIRRVDGEIKTPKVSQIRACRPWLEAEIQMVAPDCIVALGKISARSTLHRPVTIGEEHGEPLESPYGPVVVTYHPSATFHDPSYRDKIAADLQAARRLVESR